MLGEVDFPTLGFLAFGLVYCLSIFFSKRFANAKTLELVVPLLIILPFSEIGKVGSENELEFADISDI